MTVEVQVSKEGVSTSHMITGSFRKKQRHKKQRSAKNFKKESQK